MLMTVSKDLNHSGQVLRWRFGTSEADTIIAIGQHTCWQTVYYTDWWSSLDCEAVGEDQAQVVGLAYSGIVVVGLYHCVHPRAEKLRRVETSFPDMKRTLISA